MRRRQPMILTAAMILAAVVSARGDEPKKPEAAPVSFIKDVAPILVQNCIACHNPKKSESKYIMTTFAAAGQGGPAGRGDHARAGGSGGEHARRADPA